MQTRSDLITGRQETLGDAMLGRRSGSLLDLFRRYGAGVRERVGLLADDPAEFARQGLLDVVPNKAEADAARNRIMGGPVDPQAYASYIWKMRDLGGLLGSMKVGPGGSAYGSSRDAPDYRPLAKKVDELREAWRINPTAENWGRLEQARKELHPLLTRSAEVSMANQVLDMTPIDDVLNNIAESMKMSGVPGPNLLKQISALRTKQGVGENEAIKRYLMRAAEKSPHNYDVLKELGLWERAR